MANRFNIPAPEDTKGRMKFWLENVAYTFAEAKKHNDKGALKELTIDKSRDKTNRKGSH